MQETFLCEKLSSIYSCSIISDAQCALSSGTCRSLATHKASFQSLHASCSPLSGRNLWLQEGGEQVWQEEKHTFALEVS